ncbi:MAG: LCP family protein, partial [Acidobacteriota bacterium]|nr:LCP family protein [Acidobacteriota bacterium]
MSGPEDSPGRGPLLTRWSERDPDTPVWGPAANRATLRQAATRARHRRRRRRILLGVGLVLVLIVGALAGYGEYLNHEIRRLDVRGLTASPSSGVENVLMVGSTSRCVLQQQNAAFGLCSQGVTGVNSDVVMLLHLDPNKKKVSILSIPRDLFVPNARTTGANKIDAALYQGPSQLVAAIQQDFGIPVQHYVVLNFDTFQGIVNALGGIKMYFPMPVFDAQSDLDIRQTGCLPLNGFEALAVVRARHLQYKPPTVTTMNHYAWPYDPQSDLSRIRRDHEFIRVLAGEVSKRGLANPLTDQSLVSAVAPDLQVDSGLSATDMINLVLTFHGVSPAGAPQATMPVLVHAGLSYYYQGYDYGSVELTSEPEDRQAIYQFLGLPAGRDTMTGKPLPSPSSVTVSVVNGTGV